MNDADRSWEKWGNNEPYFGVLSDERFRGPYLSENIDEFFESGEKFVDQVMKTISQELKLQSYDSAIDFGCGVGRLTIPIARNFNQVLGVDISPSMISEAKKNAEFFGSSNVAFKVIGDEFKVEETFDFVNSYIVFQHIRTERGMKILSSLLNSVKSGGVASIHISLKRKESYIKKAIYIARRELPLFRGIINLVQGRPLREPFMEMNEYPIYDVFSLLTNLGFGPCIVDPEMHGDVMTVRILTKRSN